MEEGVVFFGLVLVVVGGRGGRIRVGSEKMSRKIVLN